MKKVATFLAMLVCVVYAQAQLAQPPNGNNQKASVTQYIGPVEISITYYSPRVHLQGQDRTDHIWGELVPYGFTDGGGGKLIPWRAGANENTVVTFSNDVKVEGKDLKAGTYGLHLATSKDGAWTWIFSSNYSSWGSFSYDQKEDVLRVDVTPTAAPFTEYLMYGFDDRQPGSAVAYLQWEKKRIPFKVEVSDVNNLYVSMMRNQLRSTTGFDYRNFSNAAAFCAQNKINLDEALTWANNGSDPTKGGRAEFGTLRSKAAVLTAMGKEADADELMKKAITLPDATVPAIHQYGRGLIAAGKKEKAMEVFKANFAKNPTDPNEKFTTRVGMARGYTAVGDTKNAIKYWEEAINNIPDVQKPFIKTYQGELDKLKAAK